MDFSKQIFRSHMVGKIVSVPKPLTKSQNDTLIQYRTGKSGTGKDLSVKQKETLIDLEHKNLKSKKYSLSDGQKKILSELAFIEKHGRTNIIHSKAITKGLEKEKDSRDLLSKALGMFLIHDTERRSNEWVTGAIDIKPDNMIFDLKTAMSWQSFCKILQDKPNEVYLRQLDCYMELWGIKESMLVHTLVDTPTHIIDREIRWLDNSLNLMNLEGNVREEFIPEVKKIVYNHIFTGEGLDKFCNESTIVEKSWFLDFKEIPEEERVHMIPHSFDPIRIEQRNESIKIAREFMNTVQPINNFQPNLIK